MIDPHFHFPETFGIFVRNEGKLKNYESSNDIRSWSHDKEKQQAFLKDWMKENMIFRAVSSPTLDKALKMFSQKSCRMSTTPYCHPECKSKLLLESVRKSCNEMRACLQSHRCFEKYFEGEELETSHWPYDRSLETLKNIKVFFRIILETLFDMDVVKCSLRSNKNFYTTGTHRIKEIAKAWQKEMACLTKLIRHESSTNTRGYIIEAVNDIKVKDRNAIKKRTDKSTSSTPFCIDKSTSSYLLRTDACNDSIQPNQHLEKTIFTNVSDCSSTSQEKHVTFAEEPKIRLTRAPAIRKIKSVRYNPFVTQNETAANANERHEYESLKKEIANLRQENIRLKADLKNKATHLEWGRVFSYNNQNPRPHNVSPKNCESKQIPPKKVDSELNITIKNGQEYHQFMQGLLHSKTSGIKLDMLNWLHRKKKSPTNTVKLTK